MPNNYLVNEEDEDQELSDMYGEEALNTFLQTLTPQKKAAFMIGQKPQINPLTQMASPSVPLEKLLPLLINSKTSADMLATEKMRKDRSVADIMARKDIASSKLGLEERKLNRLTALDEAKQAELNRKNELEAQRYDPEIAMLQKALLGEQVSSAKKANTPQMGEIELLKAIVQGYEQPKTFTYNETVNRPTPQFSAAHNIRNRK